MKLTGIWRYVCLASIEKVTPGRPKTKTNIQGDMKPDTVWHFVSYVLSLAAWCRCRNISKETVKTGHVDVAKH